MDANNYLVCSESSLSPALVVAVVAIAQLGKGADLRLQLALQLPGLEHVQQRIASILDWEMDRKKSCWGQYVPGESCQIKYPAPLFDNPPKLCSGPD